MKDRSYLHWLEISLTISQLSFLSLSVRFHVFRSKVHIEREAYPFGIEVIVQAHRRAGVDQCIICDARKVGAAGRYRSALERDIQVIVASSSLSLSLSLRVYTSAGMNLSLDCNDADACKLSLSLSLCQSPRHAPLRRRGRRGRLRPDVYVGHGAHKHEAKDCK